MKKFVGLLFLSILIPGLLWAVVDKFLGVDINRNSNIIGFTSRISKVLGQEVKLSYGSDVLIGGTASADEIFSATYSAEKAVDDNTSTFWATTASAMPHWWKYDLGAGVSKTVRKLRMIEANSPVGIADFTLHGSNNDSDWDLLLTDVHSDNNNWQEYTFANATAYRYYKIIITDNHRSDTQAEIHEIEMMEIE